MAITQHTPQAQIDALFNSIAQIVAEEMQTALVRLGEMCVTRVRDRSGEESWIDQTGNLRSSIGYAVYDHGKEIFRSQFRQVLNGADGPSAGQRMIEALAAQYSNTYALVVVAGMSYAEYVEAMRNKDVLASTKLWAEKQVANTLKLAMQKAEKRINAKR
jgi:hypothetical protein